MEQITQTYLLIQIDRETAVAEDPESEARIFTWELVAN